MVRDVSSNEAEGAAAWIPPARRNAARTARSGPSRDRTADGDWLIMQLRLGRLTVDISMILHAP
jgi:hypothetical protein